MPCSAARRTSDPESRQCCTMAPSTASVMLRFWKFYSATYVWRRQRREPRIMQNRPRTRFVISLIPRSNGPYSGHRSSWSPGTNRPHSRPARAIRLSLHYCLLDRLLDGSLAGTEPMHEKIPFAGRTAGQLISRGNDRATGCYTEPFPGTDESKLCGLKILANKALHHQCRLDL